MLTEILSQKTCAKCRFCCVFSPSAVWEIPSEIEVDRTSLTDETVCPHMKEGYGCTLGDQKPIECQMWPLRVMKRDNKLYFTVSTRCFEYSDEFTKKLTAMLKNGLFERVLELIKTNPEIIKDYHPSYRILCSVDGEDYGFGDALFFRCPEIGDVKRINSTVSVRPEPICEYSAGSVIALAQKYDTELAFEDECMYCYMPGRNIPGYASYLMPITFDIEASIEKLKKHSELLGLKTLLWGVREDELEYLSQYGIEYDAEEMRDWFDYVYRTTDLAGLEGKALRKRKTAYNKFLNDFDGRYSFKEIEQNDIQKIREYQKKWLAERIKATGKNKGLISENDQIDYILSNYKLIEACGAYTEIDGRVAGYTICLPLGRNSLDMTTLKCDREFQNLNIFTISNFARLHTDIEYLNFEEDIGSEGLRKFKTDLQPCKLLEKYRVILK